MPRKPDDRARRKLFAQLCQTTPEDDVILRRLTPTARLYARAYDYKDGQAMCAAAKHGGAVATIMQGARGQDQSGHSTRKTRPQRVQR